MLKTCSKKTLNWWRIVFIGFIVLSLTSSCNSSTTAKQKDEIFEHHNNLAISYINQQQYKEAVKEFQQVLKVYPKHLPTIVNLGLSYHRQLKFDEAAKTFSKALAIDPDETYSHYNLGLIYYAKKRYQEAAIKLEKVVALDPNDPAARYHLAMVYAKQGRLDEAEAQFRTVIKLYPDSSSAYYGLSRVLMDKGKKEEVEEVVKKFQEIKNSGHASSEKDKYLREGKYLEPMIPIEQSSLQKEEIVRKSSSVRFVDVTSGAGLNLRHGGSRTILPKAIEPSEDNKADVISRIVSSLGSGAVLFDYDNDAYLDLYIVNCSASAEKSGNALYRNNGNGTFTDVTAEASVGNAGMGMGCTVGDYDNDGDVDVYVTNYGKNVLYCNNGNGTFTDVTETTGVGDASFSAGAVFGDYDMDGDLDLYVANYIDFDKTHFDKPMRFPHDLLGQPNQLYRNNGNGTFTDITMEAGVGGNSKTLNVVFTDYDNDRDIDIYAVNDGEANILYANNRDGTFTDITSTRDMGETDGVCIAVGDYDNEGKMDFFIVGGHGKPNLLYKNNGTEFMKIDFPVNERDFWGAGFLDYDNDGDLDIFLTGDKHLLLQNDGNDNFEDVSEDVLGKGDFPPMGRGITFGDYDNDGDTDIFVINNGRLPTLLRNEGGDRNNWLKIVVVGATSNRSAIGTKVEIKAGTLWQKREILASGYLSQNSLTAEFGLGDKTRVDVIGIIWPSGIKQFVANIPANLRTTITEAPRTSTSCPHLYTWDGSKYRFITDFLGAGAIGYLVKANSTSTQQSVRTYYYPDSDEYIKISGAFLQPKDGLYSIQILNSLQEVVYLDEIKLLAIDRPSEIDVYPNERFALTPPFPEFKIHAVKDARPPISAVDDNGNDILPLIRSRDRKYPDFELLSYKGYTKTHSMILDLGDLSEAKNIVLIVYGWIEYPESYSNLAASQGDLSIIAPSLEVINEEGEWETAVEIIGFPAGLPKNMTFDLTDKFPTENYKIRITTNLEIYWDQILVNIFSDEPPMTVTTLESINAHLHWKGYPNFFTPDGKKPYLYDYENVSDNAFWDDHRGNYTRYGDVTELLIKTDDKSVIMRHGDEITVNFAAKRLPELPSGWSRDYFFYADGFSKDMDLNTARSATVEPLPFHGMSNYPYPKEEDYPFDDEHLKYMQK
ncbi:VCBS repeat-containing protein [bacterium]|nr:VCBS repeat-containing protein [bacterium]